MQSFKALSGLIVIITCSAVHAEDTAEAWYINLHTISHHFSERQQGKQWNEANLGLGIRREFSSDFSIQAGVYRNSIDRWSTYAIGEYTPIAWGDLHAGAYAGLRTNYTEPVMAAGGAVVRWQKERYSITFRAAPKTCGQCSAFISLELGWKL